MLCSRDASRLVPVVLRTTGDSSSITGGRFHENVMANGAASKEILDALRASIVAACYGQ